jgi:hypothetical protein
MKYLKSFFTNHYAVLCLTILLSIIPLLAILYKDFSGGIALWNDPARDLLTALDNSRKPTLIGPSTGIPGVFYGPYWIWLLSFAQLFSKQPGIISFIILTLPYLLLFPLILSRFSKIFTLQTIALLWLLFLLSYANYFTDIWNPHPAPLLILLAIYLQFLRGERFSRQNILITGAAGLAAGLVMNFQLSFGIGMLFGSTIYLFGESLLFIISSYKHFQASKNITKIILRKIITIISFFLGVLIAFAPFFLFELRHNFQQTKILLGALTHFGGGLVTQTGLTKPQIIQSFFGRISDLLHLPFWIATIIFSFAAIYYMYSSFSHSERSRALSAGRRGISLKLLSNLKIHFSRDDHLQERKLFLIILCIALGVLYIYLTAKNPVWSYHFIGVEILFLLLIGIILNRIKYIWILIACWVALSTSGSLLQSLHHNPQTIYGTAASEEQTVTKVQQEAQGQDYTVFAYEAGIYPYEYSYLFHIMYNKDMPYRPELNPKDASLVFVIFPPNLQSSLYHDFINFRTPQVRYKTTAHWTEADGTQILERNRIL